MPDGNYCHEILFIFKAKTAQELLNELHHTSASKRLDALKQLSYLSQDITLAQEFINKKGLYIIIEMVETSAV